VRLGDGESFRGPRLAFRMTPISRGFGGLRRGPRSVADPIDAQVQRPPANAKRSSNCNLIGSRHPPTSESPAPHPASRNAPVLPSMPTRTDRFGARFWGQVRGFSGPLRVLQGDGAAHGETTRIAGKARYQAPSRHHIAASRSLHGKEAVPGSSPGEGLNTCKSAFFHHYRVPPDHGGPRKSDHRAIRAAVKNPCKSGACPI
jgi:hypothetical protein